MLTATCGNCGAAKDPANYADNHCPACTSVSREAQQGYAAEHPDATVGDILYAGRVALSHRAHHAHRNYADPRSNSMPGMVPIPPQTNRGNTE